MKFRILGVTAVAAFLGAFGLATSPAMATETIPPSGPCHVQGAYQNPDEQDLKPEYTANGAVFTGKDLVHFKLAEKLDFPDVKPYTLKFVDSNPGKLLGKMETENPYSTIIQNADGKFWSTAMDYGQIGGQGHPVDQVSDLIDTTENPRPVKAGKVKFSEASHVVTYGVTTNFTCILHTSGPTGGPTKTSTTKSTPKPSASTSHVIAAAGGTSGGEGGSLAITGENTTRVIIVGSTVLVGGGAMVWFTRRRRQKFSA